MFLTEEEASRRWCPLARSFYQAPGYNLVSPVGGYQLTTNYQPTTGSGPYYGNVQSQYIQGSMVSANRDMPNNTIPSCIGSSCMFWRFAAPKKLRDIDPVTSDIEDEHPRKGYCGAASRPEWD